MHSVGSCSCASCGNIIMDTAWMNIVNNNYHDKCVTREIIQLAEYDDARRGYFRPYKYV